MNIQTKGTNVQLTNNVKRYLDKRVSSLEKYINPDDSSVKCQVEVEKTTEHHKKGDIYRSEINMRIAKAKFRAEATAEKLFDAIDESRNQMAKELRRHKSKHVKSIRKGGAKIKAMARGEI